MIVRCWWPLQESVRRHPLAACAALAGLGAGGIGGLLQREWPRPLTLALAAGVLGILVQVHGVACQALAILALIASVAVVQAVGATATDLALLLPAAVLLLGASGEIARRRPPSHVQHGIGRATSLVTLAIQWAVVTVWDQPMLWLGWILVTLLAVTLVVPLAARRGDATTAMESLAPERDDPLVRWIVPAVLLLATLPTILSPDPRVIPDPASLWWRLVPIAVLWSMTSQQPLTAIAVSGGTALGIAGVVAAGLPGDPTVMGAAQVLPLLMWLGRQAQGGIFAHVSLTAAVVLAATALLVPAWQAATLIAAGSCLGIACCPRTWARPHAAPTRWLHTLDPYWRWYGLAKLRLDPVFARLSGDGRPWGRVLDAGCGPGLGAALAAARPDTVAYTGIDLDRDKLLVARRILRVAGRELDASWSLLQARLPLTTPMDGPFDTILLLDVLHYWPLEIQRAVLAQLLSLLAADGRLWLRDGTASTGQVARGERFTTWFGLNPRGQVQFLSESDLRALLESIGFRIVSVEPAGAENRLWLCERAMLNL